MKSFLAVVLCCFSFSVASEEVSTQLNVGEKVKITAEPGETFLYEIYHDREGRDLKIKIKPRKKDRERNADADIFVWSPGQSMDELPECRPMLRSAEETCLFKNAKAGTYKVRVNAITSVKKLKLKSRKGKNLSGGLPNQEAVTREVFSGSVFDGSGRARLYSTVIEETQYNNILSGPLDLAYLNVKLDGIEIALERCANGKVYFCELPILRAGSLLEIEIISDVAYSQKSPINLHGIQDDSFEFRKVMTSYSEKFDILDSDTHFIYEPIEIFVPFVFDFVVVSDSVNSEIFAGKNRYSDSVVTSVGSEFYLSDNKKAVAILNITSSLYYIDLDVDEEVQLEVRIYFNRDGSPVEDCIKNPSACGGSIIR